MAFCFFRTATDSLPGGSFLAQTLERAHHFFEADWLPGSTLAEATTGLEQGFYWLLPDEVSFLFDLFLNLMPGNESRDSQSAPQRPNPIALPETWPWRGARRPFRRSATR